MLLIALSIVIIIIIFYLIRQRTCFGIVPKQFIYKTLQGDVVVAYVGEICNSNRQSVLQSIVPVVDIVLTHLPDSPVISTELDYLENRGWYKIGYHPRSIYQAADIERSARAIATNSNILVKDNNIKSCTDDRLCSQRFAKYGCSDTDMLRDCPITCNTCGLNPAELKSITTSNSIVSSCVPMESFDKDYLF